MPTIFIDGREVRVEAGATVLDAARQLGIDIPALCYRDGCEASTSCMCCVVKVVETGRLVPSCATAAADGLRVESETDEVRAARRAALELLLSDHLGDCQAPCQAACPAGMDIPRMVRRIAAGRLADAIAIVKAHIALPAVCGRICPAPCEKACRRAGWDDALAIRHLKRHVADADLASPEPYLPPCAPATGRAVAIVGAGPAGLAAAWRLLQDGVACTVFDDHPAAGGALRYGLGEGRLDPGVLDAEAAIVARLGAGFRLNRRVADLADLRGDFDAVFLAPGPVGPEQARQWQLDATERGLRIDRKTHQTSAEGVFAGGAATGATRMAVRALAEGQRAAIAIGQYLRGEPVRGRQRRFTCRIGRMDKDDIAPFLTPGVSRAARHATPPGGFDDQQARAEADRCLHCDCRKPDTCKLRTYADAYGAKARRFGRPRRAFVQDTSHPDVIYEPGKCIACGLCVQIASSAGLRHGKAGLRPGDAGEALGLTFVGRGFDVRVAVPFDASLAEGLKAAAAECVAACPTGALAFRDDDPGE